MHRPSPRPSSRLGSPLCTPCDRRLGSRLPPGPCVPSLVGSRPGHCRPSPGRDQDSARHPHLFLSSASSLSETHHPAHQPWPPSSSMASTAARGDPRPEETPPAAASELFASDRRPSPCCGPSPVLASHPSLSAPSARPPTSQPPGRFLHSSPQWPESTRRPNLC